MCVSTLHAWHACSRAHVHTRDVLAVARGEAVQELKEKYTQAKALGARANELRVAMAAQKQQIEQRRMQRAAADIAAGGTGAAAAEGDEDAGALAELAEQRAEYKAAFGSLREHKQDIERLQGLLERSRQQMAVRMAPRLCVYA